MAITASDTVAAYLSFLACQVYYSEVAGLCPRGKTVNVDFPTVLYLVWKTSTCDCFTTAYTILEKKNKTSEHGTQLVSYSCKWVWVTIALYVTSMMLSHASGV